MPKPVCVKCKLFYRPKKTGMYWVEGCPRGDKWVPYKIWSGDMYECKGCGSQIVVGHGGSPIRENHMPDFNEMRDSLTARLQVDDC